MRDQHEINDSEGSLKERFSSYLDDERYSSLGCPQF